MKEVNRMTTLEINEQLKQALADAKRINEEYAEQLKEKTLENEELKETVDYLKKKTLRKIAKEKRTR